MVNIDELTKVEHQSSSKGNQVKFYHNNMWYKIDSPNCYQGLAEEFVSQIESCIEEFTYVGYKSIKCLYNEEEVNACCSQNMYNPTTQFVSFRNLLRQNGISSNIFIKYNNISDNIQAVREIIKQITSLDILNYLRDLLFLDALIINEDRHYMNLGVCFTDNEYRIAPCFDNGSSLFCVNWTYRKTKTFEENIKRSNSSARPFSKFFDKQVNALLELGCEPLVIDMQRLNQVITEYDNKNYSIGQISIIKQVLIDRLKNYKGIVYVEK